MNWSRTSRRDAWLRLQAAHVPDWVIGHSAAVEGLAFAMARRGQEMGLAVDADVVVAGAVLHDIGRSVTQDVRHASIGADLLRREGWAAEVVRCVECHTGAGILPEEARRLGLPDRDYMPRSLEERLVCHADNLHTGPRRVTVAQVLAKYRAKGLAEAGARIQDLHEELEALLECDLEALQPAALADAAPGPPE